jgi:hypothetical protein
VNGIDVEFVIDTGADVTVVTDVTRERLGLKCEIPDRLILNASGAEMNVVGQANVRIRTKSAATNACVTVVRDAAVNLLGKPQIRNLRLLKYVNLVSSAFNPLTDFPELFEGLGTMPGTFTIRMKKEVEPIHLYAARPVAAGLREKAKAELDSMLEQGVIEAVERPTEWCSGLTIAPKPNGGIRMCVDLTALNKGVKREVYPFPKVSDMLSRLSGGRVFSKLDANSGFWQVPLDPECKLLTTFITPWGRFCFRRMPFGISSAPEFFQRAMEKVLSGLSGVICLMDDILVYGKDADQHWSRLRRVLSRIRKAGMTLKKEKCEFGRGTVKFLGHVVSSAGVAADPEKIRAIKELQPPNTRKEARRFLGMINYLGKFRSKLSGLCVPIQAVVGKNSDWQWQLDQQAAFDAIKKEISSTPVLCPFDLERRHRVSSDASKSALGAVLLQLSESGCW